MAILYKSALKNKKPVGVHHNTYERTYTFAGDELVKLQVGLVTLVRIQNISISKNVICCRVCRTLAEPSRAVEENLLQLRKYSFTFTILIFNETFYRMHCELIMVSVVDRDTASLCSFRPDEPRSFQQVSS